VASELFGGADPPAAVGAVLRMQTATSPASRCASGAEFVRELDGALGGQLGSGTTTQGRVGRAGSGRSAVHAHTSHRGGSRRFGTHGRFRAAPDARLALTELPDGARPPTKRSARRVSRRT